MKKFILSLLVLTSCSRTGFLPSAAEKGVCHCDKKYTVNLSCYSKYGKYSLYKTVEVDPDNRTIAAFRLYDNNFEIFTFEELENRRKVACP